MEKVEMTRRTMIGGLASASAASAASAALEAASPRSNISKASMTIVDVHSHALLPLWIAAAAKAQGSNERGVSISGLAVPKWSPESHIQIMDRYTIAKSLLSWPRGAGIVRGQAARDLARAMNEEYARIIARFPGRFGAFAALPYDDMDAAIEETAYALDVLKLDGVTATTQVDGAYLGDPRYDEWLAEMDRRKAVLFVHPTPPPAFSAVDIGLNVAILEYMFDITRMISNMIFSGAKSRFANIKFICTHGGGTIPYLASRLQILEPIFGAGAGRKTLSPDEIGKLLGSFYYDLTASTSFAQLDAIRQIVPVSKLLMGSDYPMMPEETIAPALARFNKYPGFDERERVMIKSGNYLNHFAA